MFIIKLYERSLLRYYTRLFHDRTVAKLVTHTSMRY
jgi:hypothetical protein